jgi:hypothetical protein
LRFSAFSEEAREVGSDPCAYADRAHGGGGPMSGTPRDDLGEAIAKRQVLVVVGAGVAVAAAGREQPAASWIGLLESGVRRCEDYVGLSADQAAAARTFPAGPQPPARGARRPGGARAEAEAPAGGAGALGDAGHRAPRGHRGLLAVRRLCGLPPSAAKLDGDQRHVGALIQIFLAHTYRYRAAADDAERVRRYGQAAGYYDAAVGLLRQEEGADWGNAWALFERAELHAEHGGAQAREDWHGSAELVPDLGDDELAANLHRLAADVRWPGAPSDAFAAHGRAVLHAYLFQARNQGAPDAYTRDFFCEQVDRAVDRLIAHARAGGDLREAVDGSGLRSPG